MKKRVAIIGLSFRFPSTNTDQYWTDLLDGRDLVTEVESSRWAKDGFLHPDKNHPGSSYTFAAGSVGDVSLFDAGFFGISPREAALMDPQQRLLLEMSWEALENAGIKPSTLRGSQCGVFIGIASADYAYRLSEDLSAIDSSVATGNTASIAANRISYVLDLQGPSMAIDTACSSSMVAFHQACRSIVSGETTQALAGGVSLHLHPYGFITFSKATMLSKRGRCNVFDAAGDGYVRSEGGGMFVLKDYDQAVADGDRILAVVANTAVNTDGRKTGLTVPSPKVQSALLNKAYSEAGIDPADIDYVEAHGTGTAVGDPIEARAIGDALGKRRSRDNPLLIGSVKSNMGHLEAASGVAGLVKALYAIQHRVVPATIGIKTLNPKIEFDDWNIQVATEPRQLKKSGKLIVGINSFGFGGANAHVILESHEPAAIDAQGGAQAAVPAAAPFILSAKDPAALKDAARAFADFVQDQPAAALYDIAYSAAFRRERHEQCAVVEGATGAAVAQALRAFAEDSSTAKGVESGTALAKPLGPVFVYSGNGSQWAGMGKRLLEESAVFKAAVQQVDAIFQRYSPDSLEAELAGRNGEDRYEFTEVAQPALFALQVGVTQMLRQRGVMPVAVAGHSVGEVAAAWASGALTLEAAVEVIYQRSRLQGTTKGKGEMTAVGLGHGAAESILAELGLTPGLVIAGMNSSRGVTIAGDPALLTQMETALTERGVFNRRLALDYAFHSPAMDEIEAGVRVTLAGLQPGAASVPFYSTVTGGLLDGTALGAEYWWHNIRQPVRFEQAMMQIMADGTNVFVEVGPHAVLRSYINDCLKDQGTEGRVIPTLARGDDAAQRVWSACSQVLIAGAGIDWQQLFPTTGNFVQLPYYPWQRERHWHPVTAQSLGLLDRQKVHPLLGYALQQQALTWENQLDPRLNPMLADHVVGDTTIFPGTGFGELALAAALQWQPGTLAEVEELEIRAPLLLNEGSAKIVRVSIDPQDGSLSVKGREVGSTDPWTLHTVGRILREPRDGLLRQDAPVLPTRQPDFSGDSHAALTEAAGLGYGPAFQCIDFGWVEGGSALAVLKMPQSIEAELAQTHLHPAVLDCTFQLIIQLLKDEMGVHEGLTFIPTKMGRISFRASQAQPGFARVTLLRRTAHSLSAEFTVFDTEGVPIAAVKEARFRSIRLSKNAADRLRFLDYHGIPQPHALAGDAAPAIAFDSVHSALAELARRSALTGSHRRYCEEVDPLLDSLCSRFTRQAFERLSADGRKLFTQQVLALQSANPEIAPFLAHLLLLASDDQAITHTPDGWELVPGDDEQASAEDIWNALVADYPDYFQIVHSVGRIGMHLPQLLQGTETLDKVCPRETSLVTLLRQALGAKSKQRIGRTLQELIAQGLRQLPEGQRLRLVEISEGAPSFAMDACLGLDADRADYAFASQSAAALEEAARLKEQFPHIDTRQIGSAAPVPGCQLAIVSLDFAAVPEAVAALEYARACLAPGGSLVVVGQHASRWIDFVFGAQQKNWSLTENGSWLSNQRPVQFWQQQLQQLGFADTDLFELSPDTLSGPYLLLSRPSKPAQLPATEAKRAPRSWILLADAQGVSAQLSDQLVKKLQARGDMVVQAGPGDTAAIEALLRTTTASYGKLDGIVHLAGIASAATEAEAVLEQQVARCALAAAIVQACESTSTSTTCWLVTQAGASDLLPNATATPVQDAALWGFGRTLINEASDCEVRLVDLESTLALDTVVGALAQELEQPDAEQEVVLTQGGARYVPRLRLAPRPQVQQEIDSPTIRLAFQYPGQLRNLRWEAHPRAMLRPGEIEVDVRATGLNFRDVMYALGLLSDEAIENGFAGPTLGLEFSGVVTAVADADCGYAPGDLVVGFGPSSFGNRVVTQASAISLIPPEISLEAAATIPSTFFTVYYALHHLARLQPGEKVLIHGAAGGVGIAAIQLAKWIGAEIYVTAGSDEKRDFLRQLGVDHIYDSRSLAFSDEILAQTGGKGVDVVLNSLAGEAINRNFRVLKPFGRFLELGKRDFYENTKIGLRPFRNNISYFGIDADQLMQSRPELTRSLFAEMMALFTEGVLHPLPYHVFDANDIVEAFRYMQQARQIGKIVVTYSNDIGQIHTPAPAAPKPLELAADGSYLVTGGLGGFGLRTAEWLAAKGARHLVLISRSGPSADAAKAAIARLEQQGVKVHAAACDITDRQALAGLLADIGRSMPPLKGIVHAATVINDGLIRNMDAAQIRSVLAPKAMGAQHLHELTLGTALDFFVMFSSATTLFGNPGQGNYVAANACLEALAKYRRANGLAATCVRWGAIDDVGFLARNEKIKDALQGRMGGSALNSTIALDALESMMTTDQSGLGVMELDWKALARFLPSAGSPKFSELARDAMDNEADEEDSGDIQRVLAELSDAELQVTLTDMIKSEVGEILRVSPEKIDPNRSIYDMGLDSLMGVELVVALEGRFGIQLSVMALSQSPTIAKLAERIGLQLKGSDEQGGAPAESQVLAQTRQIMEQHGSEVSAESIASLAQDIESQDTAVRMIN
ncbi:type I polyketide synthase [Comamonas endophytica]|uniref:Type I polyketide synthase n=2 Tax=Comamonas endophytica TaxID=2949090 RepID=A0ABY6GFB6_9BURK|nr:MULTISPECIES: type I polyketide synthase [unclassified Acidovorax]MCD2512437.1 type I polyketide synthase [Acidovorax sp. D4N7]UYG53192.1 type I polyketide synthase [Acidovorax sp. 5MLIR]